VINQANIPRKQNSKLKNLNMKAAKEDRERIMMNNKIVKKIVEI
jgi:hypothetical protein